MSRGLSVVSADTRERRRSCLELNSFRIQSNEMAAKVNQVNVKPVELTGPVGSSAAVDDDCGNAVPVWRELLFTVRIFVNSTSKFISIQGRN